MMINSDNEGDFGEWLQKGIDNEWITEPFCSTHDGDPYMTEEEEQEWEDGGDPCCHVIKIKL
jgi:hypothetical protein